MTRGEQILALDNLLSDIVNSISSGFADDIRAFKKLQRASEFSASALRQAAVVLKRQRNKIRKLILKRNRLKYHTKLIFGK